MKVTRRKHASRFLVAVICGAVAVYADYGVKESEKSLLQMAVWTLFLFLICVIEFRGTVFGRSLNRPVMRYVALSLIALHFVFLYAIRDRFPFQNSLSVVLLFPFELLVLLLLYLKLGFMMDPKGPLAMNTNEHKKWKKHRERWGALLKKPHDDAANQSK